MKKRKLLIGVLAVLAAIVAIIAWRCCQQPVAPQHAAELKQAAEGLDEILISAELLPQKRSLSVRQTMRLTNRTGQKQEAAVLRTWPNAFQSLETSPCAAEEELFDRYYPAGFSSGALVMAHAEANEQSVSPHAGA